MRRTTPDDDPEQGLAAALKALAVVAAVGMLALVAGKSAYTSGAATEVSPTYQMLHPVHVDPSKAGAASPGNASPEPLSSKTAPSGAIAVPEFQAQKSARAPAAPSPLNTPVATF